METRSITMRLLPVAGALLAACGATTVEHAAQDPAARPVGRFVVECALDRVAADDPILHAGHPGASHLHQFFGAVGVGATSDHRAYVGGPTTCATGETGSYWAPLLLLDDRDPIPATGVVATHRAGPGVEPTDVVPYPPGLMLVAGDAAATEPQAPSVVTWSCGAAGPPHATPPACPGASGLRMIVTFPDCWNGIDTAPADWDDPARRHVVYSAESACPGTHPVPIPQLEVAVDYPPLGAGRIAGLALSSGDIHSGHADFWNTWEHAELRDAVVRCIHHDVDCHG